MFEPIASALAYAHEQDAAHLALAPSNVFLAKQDGKTTLKLLDFGVGRVVDDVVSSRGGTVSAPAPRMKVLLPTYAAPEQLLATLGPAGPWTDVYALALVLLEVLADRPVMSEKDPSALVARALSASSRPTAEAHGVELPAAASAAFARALSLEPELRHATVAEFWSEIRAAAKPARVDRRKLAAFLRRRRRARRVDSRRRADSGFPPEEPVTTKARGVVAMLTARAVRASTRPPPPGSPSRKAPAPATAPPLPGPVPPLPPKPRAPTLVGIAPPARRAPPVPAHVATPPPPPVFPSAHVRTPAPVDAPAAAPAPPAPEAIVRPPDELFALLPPDPPPAAEPPAAEPPAAEPPAPRVLSPPRSTPPPTLDLPSIMVAPPPLAPPPLVPLDSSGRLEPHELPILASPFARPTPRIDRRVIVAAASALGVSLVALVAFAVVHHGGQPVAPVASASPSAIVATTAPPPSATHEAPPVPPPPSATTEPTATATAAPEAQPGRFHETPGGRGDRADDGGPTRLPQAPRRLGQRPSRCGLRERRHGASRAIERPLHRRSRQVRRTSHQGDAHRPVRRNHRPDLRELRHPVLTALQAARNFFGGSK